MKPSVLWIGRTTAEFAGVRQSLQGKSTLRTVGTLQAAANCQPTDHVLCIHDRPGELDLQEINAFQQSCPNARFTHLLGAWCCGENRITREYAGVHAVYVHQWLSHPEPMRLLNSVASSGGNQDSAAASSFAASVIGITSHELALAAVYAETRGYRESLLDALQHANLPAVGLDLTKSTPVVGVRFVIWESPQERSQRSDDLHELRQRHPDACVLALVTFPRQDEFNWFSERDAQVLAQPFALNELFHHIRQPKRLPISSAA